MRICYKKANLTPPPIVLPVWVVMPDYRFIGIVLLAVIVKFVVFGKFVVIGEFVIIVKFVVIGNLAVNG